MKQKQIITVLALLSIFAQSEAFAQASESTSNSTGATNEDINNSNNPLTPMLGLNAQDYYVPSLYGINGSEANTGLIRGVIPFKLAWPQITRITLPVSTSPSPGSETGLSDLNIIDIFLLKAGSLKYGAGPQLTLPTATDDKTGTGKWQLGAAFLAFSPYKLGLLGALVTWQHSIAGDDVRPGQNNLQAQPFATINLPKAYYIRTSGVWNFNLETDDYYMPLGIGAGKCWKTKGGTVINLFAEPQFTVAHEGIAPRWQIFSGLNFQFPMRGPKAASEPQPSASIPGVGGQMNI